MPTFDFNKDVQLALLAEKSSYKDDESLILGFYVEKKLIRSIMGERSEPFIVNFIDISELTHDGYSLTKPKFLLQYINRTRNDWSVRMDRPFCERSEHYIM